MGGAGMPQISLAEPQPAAELVRVESPSETRRLWVRHDGGVNIRRSLALSALVPLLVVSAVLGLAGTAAAADGPCTLLSDVEAASLISTRNVAVHARVVRKDAEETDCVWTAKQVGYTEEAPAEGMLTLRVVHKASPAAAEKDMAEGRRKGTVLALARTVDATDEQLDWTGDRFAARRGGVIAVADGSAAVSLASDKPDWRYRLQALALRAVGASVLGPTAEAADACGRVRKPQMLALLTLQPSRLELTPDGWNRCMMSVKDRSGTIDGWTTNDSHGDLRISDLGSNAAALKFLKQQLPFLKPSDLVRTQDAGDRVVAQPDHPGEVWAVHGPYYVELNLPDATAQARAHPTWRYRVQRAALQAAGATIVASPGMPPDPAVSDGVDGDRPHDAPRSRWTPPAHDPPTWSVILEPLAMVAAFLSHYRFFVLPVALFGGIAFSVWRGARAKAQGRTSAAWMLTVSGVALGLVSIMFGPWISSDLVYMAGRSASAVITGTYGTGSQYNSHDVLGHNVLIRTTPGHVTQTRFSSDQFNVYPSHNATTYPGQGAVFTVRYLPHFPKVFVIVANDDSPFARSLRCGALLDKLQEAQKRSDFAGGAEPYASALRRVRGESVSAGCGAATE